MSARRVSTRGRSTRSPEEVTRWVSGALANGEDATWKDHRVTTPAWKDTKEEAQLDTLRAALTAISAAESELEEIRRQDEVHVREQERELRERREQAERLEQAELQIRELAASTGAPLLRSRGQTRCPLQSTSVFLR